MLQTVKYQPTVQWPGFSPWVGKIPWRREWQPTPVFLPGEFHGQRNLTGYTPRGYKESDTTEQLMLCFHFSYKEIIRLMKLYIYVSFVWWNITVVVLRGMEVDEDTSHLDLGKGKTSWRKLFFLAVEWWVKVSQSCNKEEYSKLFQREGLVCAKSWRYVEVLKHFIRLNEKIRFSL